MPQLSQMALDDAQQGRTLKGALLRALKGALLRALKGALLRA
jgi:hypothetical protein